MKELLYLLIRIALFAVSIILSKLCFADIFYVSTKGSSLNDGKSWGSPLDDLQTAIDLCFKSGGGEVWISEGIYKYGKPISMRNGVSIIGKFKGRELKKDSRSGTDTILSGEKEYRVFHNSNVESAVLEDITIANGFHLENGAGVYNENSNIIFKKCTFRDNKIFREGSYFLLVSELRGAAMHNVKSNVTLSGCTFESNDIEKRENNKAKQACGAGIHNEDSVVSISNCTFNNNSIRTRIEELKFDIVHFIMTLDFSKTYSKGGAISSYNSDLSIGDSKFIKNRSYSNVNAEGGAIFMRKGKLVIFNNTFEKNRAMSLRSAGGGAIFIDSSSVQVEDSEFLKNESDESAGAVHAIYSDCRFSKCNFKKNIASIRGGAIKLISSKLKLEASQFEKNESHYERDIAIDSKSSVFPVDAKALH